LCVQAVDCVSFFRGKTVAEVGEWDGDTGTAAFAIVLARSFRLKEGGSRRKRGRGSEVLHEYTGIHAELRATRS
jgi:hypothetical protein